MRVKLIKNDKRAVQSFADCTAPSSVQDGSGGGNRYEICRRLCLLRAMFGLRDEPFYMLFKDYFISVCLDGSLRECFSRGRTSSSALIYVT